MKCVGNPPSLPGVQDTTAEKGVTSVTVQLDTGPGRSAMSHHGGIGNYLVILFPTIDGPTQYHTHIQVSGVGSP